MRRKGINYDVGTFTRQDESSRPTLDPVIMQREMEIITQDLHCTAIRISGQEITRLTMAAEEALRQGLEVWLSPALVDATEHETLVYLAECAQAAEQLRKKSPRIVFVVGCEFTFFMKGLVDGNTALERMQTFTKPWRLLKSALVKGPFNRRLNAFLTKATAIVRKSFQGSLTYAAGPWETVDWSLFDFVGIDYYRDARNASSYRQTLRTYFKHGKPVVILEFGCCTYQGAADKGGYGWAIVDRDASPQQLRGTFMRDEPGQARYLMELLEIFGEEQVEGTFVFTFVMPSYPYSIDPRYDLDMASYSLVKTFVDQTGKTYPELPWEPKDSFRELAHYYQAEATLTSHRTV
jgi:hypothetical protein